MVWGTAMGWGEDRPIPHTPPGVTRSTWSSDIERNTTELLCGRAPLSLRFSKESQNVTMASNDRAGLLANTDTGQQREMLTDQWNADVENCIENEYRKYKWYRIRDRDCSDAEFLLHSEIRAHQPQFPRTLKGYHRVVKRDEAISIVTRRRVGIRSFNADMS